MESIVANSEANDSNHTNSDISGSVSVVQVIPGQTVQVINSDVDNAASADEDSESKKRREMLARRPSYRRILNDLSSTENPSAIAVAKIEEESDENSSDSHDDVTGTLTNSVGGVTIQAASLMQPGSLKVVPGQTIQIAAHGDSPSPGLQTLTMTNASGANIISPTGGATIVQYAQAADGQFLIPVSTIGGSGIQYQIAGTTASLPQGVVMATSGGSIPAAQVSEEASRKRELRLLKNREAARECRRKKKEYVKCLENRVAVLENQNKTLIEELKSLKELYCQKEGQS